MKVQTLYITLIMSEKPHILFCARYLIIGLAVDGTAVFTPYILSLIWIAVLMLD